METQYHRVRYEVPAERVARVTLARPEKRNAQDYRMLYELDDALLRATSDDDIRVIILAADGPHFSAGHDQTERGELSDVRPVGTERGWTKPGIEGGYALGREVYFDTHWRWRNIPKPLIAQAQGKSVGAGMMLLWVCDIIIAAEDAQFADPVVHIGCNGVEYFAHPWEFGPRKAKELLFTSDWMTAAEAKECGMVNQVVPLVELESTTLRMACRIAKQPSMGLKLAKEAVNGMLEIQGQYNALREAYMLCTIGHAQLRSQGPPEGRHGRRILPAEDVARCRVGMTASPKRMPFGRRVSELAQQHPGQLVVTVVSESGDTVDTTWAELEHGSLAATRVLLDHGVSSSSRVVIALSREVAHVMFAVAAWRVGACVVPLNPALSPYERQRMLNLANPTVVIGHNGWSEAAGHVDPGAYLEVAPVHPRQLRDVIPQPGKAMASGGSTGSPKLIVNQRPWGFVPGEPLSRSANGLRLGQRQLVTGPLHHNSPFNNVYGGLFQDHYLVLMERFDAARAVDLIGQFKISYLALVPAQLQRMLGPAGEHRANLSSIEAILHTGAPCPARLKRAWIELVGGERIYEMFGSTEEMGSTAIRGDEWLEHPGSVGRPWRSLIKVLGPDLQELPPDEIGEIFGRPRG